MRESVLMEIQAKSNLAKLLATENLTVEHQNVPTAMFDLKARKVILPKLKEMIPELYDLFIGHEVSHGLETPPEGWHEATCDAGRGFKSFLNVIEDARIEKKIKARYPGLVKSFAKGYKELLARDFFGLKNREISELPLIDRINLHFKGGTMMNIPFSPEELPFVTATAKCDTWDDVVELANSLFDYSKTEDAMQNQMEQSDEFTDEMDEEEMLDAWDDECDDSGMESDQDGEATDEDSDEDGAPSDDVESSSEQSETTDEDGKSSPMDNFETEENDNTQKAESGDDIKEGSSKEASLDPEAMTDTNFREREKELVRDDDLETLNVNWPKLKTKNLVMDCADVWDWTPSYENYSSETFSVEKAENMLLESFNKKHKTTINQLVQQFEMKRKATAIKKQRENKTGKLNEDKLWAYRLTDDLFLSSTTVPDGQNHGMLMLLDMSGSMYQQMQATLEQLMIQVAFCKKVSIPFKVFGFTSALSYQRKLSDLQEFNVDDIIMEDQCIGLLELISSNLTRGQYTKVFKRLLGYGTAFSKSYGRREFIYGDGPNNVEMDRYSVPSHLNLGMTPLAEGIMILRDVAIDFKESNNLEVLNTIILTDGDNSTTMEVIESVEVHNDEFGTGRDYLNAKKKRMYGSKFSDIYIKEGAMTTRIQPDRYSSRGLAYSAFSNAMMQHYKKTTGSRMIGFRLVEPNLRQARDQYFNTTGRYDYAAFDTAKKTWNTDKFIEVINAPQYDALYLIKGGKGLDVEQGEMEVKSTSKGDLRRGFKKFTQSRSSSRVFLNRFIEKVA